MSSLHTVFERALSAHHQALHSLPALAPRLEALGETLVSCLRSGGKLLIFGNGGSAGDAQHIAAELTGRYVSERRGLAAIALTTDTSALTAIANDYGYDHVFARQVEALARPGDVVLGISTSGNSANVLRALEAALHIGCACFGFSGRDGGAMNALLGERNMAVRVTETARVQECHILLGHMLCEMVDQAFVGEQL